MLLADETLPLHESGGIRGKEKRGFRMKKKKAGNVPWFALLDTLLGELVSFSEGLGEPGESERKKDN